MKRQPLIKAPIVLFLFLLLTSAGCRAPDGPNKENAMTAVCRINCGSSAAYTDSAGNVWEADRDFTGGKTAVREPTLPVHETAAPEIYRTERYEMERYSLPVEAGTYIVRLHFAETFDCNFEAGARSFGVRINGKTVLETFDPFRAAGAFALPAVMEYAGCPAEDRIDIEFTGKAMINGIEVFRAEPGTRPAVRQIMPPAQPGRFFIGRRLETDPAARTLKVLFIGNSMTFFWAIPESLQAMLETGVRNLRIEPHRSLYGGKGLEYHYHQTDALKRIETGRFDLVVLQPGSNEQLDGTNILFEYTAKFNEAIRASGAKPVLYAQPGGANTTDAERRQIMQNCLEAGRQTGAPVIPACETLRLCIAGRPDIQWHNADRVHTGMYGGYAVACAFYAFLTGGAPFPPPAVLAQQVAIDSKTAVFIQQNALQALHPEENR